MLDCCEGGMVVHMSLHANGASCSYSLAHLTVQHACVPSLHRQVGISFLGTTRQCQQQLIEFSGVSGSIASTFGTLAPPNNVNNS